MHLLERVSCGILLYGPYAALGLIVLQRRAQLFLIWLLAVTWGFITAYWITGLLFSSLQPQFNADQSRSQYGTNAVDAWFPWCSGRDVARPPSIHWEVMTGLIIWLFHQFAQFFSKSALFVFLLFVNGMLRRDHQVLISTRFRFTPIGCVVGLGYGAASLLLSIGFILDAELQLVGSRERGSWFSLSPQSSAANSITAYDLHVCPQMPVLVHRSLQALLFSLSSASWGIVHGICVAAVYQKRKEARLGVLANVYSVTSSSLLRHSGRIHGSGDLGRKRSSTEMRGSMDDDKFTRGGCREEEPSGAGDLMGDAEAALETFAEKSSENCESDDAESTLRKKLSESGCRNCDQSVPLTVKKNGSPSCSSAAGGQEALQIPEDSSFTQISIKVSFYTLAVVFFLQLFFTGLTLQFHTSENHRGAFSCETFVVYKNGGCMLSLPLQLVITASSILLAAHMTKMEFSGSYE